MLGNGNHEREGVAEGSVALQALKYLSLIPSEDWKEIPEYQETSEQRQFAVRGYQTALEVSGSSFDLRVESLLNLAPDSMSVPVFLYISPFRLRVVREGDPTHLDYGFDRASIEESFAQGIYKRLNKEITAPRERGEEDAEMQLRDDFESAMAKRPIKVKLTPGQRRIVEETERALREGDREAFAKLLQRGARELADQIAADLPEVGQSSLKQLINEVEGKETREQPGI